MTLPAAAQRGPAVITFFLGYYLAFPVCLYLKNIGGIGSCSCSVNRRQIVYEAEEVMLVNKPAGVPAHATVDNYHENMLGGLR